MSSRTWLFGLILAVPLLGFAVAEGIQAHFNSELRSALREQFSDADPAAISQVTLDGLCEEPSEVFPEFRTICATNDNLNLMSSASIAAGAIGLFLLAGIRFAGLIARSKRSLLLYLFKPGLYITALALIGLVLVHASITITAIYYVQSVFLVRVHIWNVLGEILREGWGMDITLLAIGGIGLGALFGVLAIARNSFSLVRHAQELVIGETISRDKASSLWSEVDEIAKTLGALRPENIVVGLDPNFFVTEANIVYLGGSLVGRTMYCSLPLMRILSKDEFKAIVGHELGHFKGLDAEFSQKFFPIYRGTADSIVSLQEAGADFFVFGFAALLPAIAIFSYFFESFSVAESTISRSRELAADSEGARVTDSATIATALVKLHAFSGLWEGLQCAAEEALQEGQAFVNASKTYAEAVVEHANPDALDGIAEMHLSHPTDSHPPLAVRLDSLGISMKQVAERSLRVNLESRAVDLISGAEQVEETISIAYQAMLAEQLGIDLDSQAGDHQEDGT